MFFYFLFRLGQFLAWILPRSLAYCFAALICRLKFTLGRKERVFVINNFRIILAQDGKNTYKYARNLYGNFGRYLVDFFRAHQIDRKFVDKFVRIEGRENMDAALAQGKGAIGLSAHIGNWELSAQILGVLGYKISVVALVHSNPRIDNFFNNQRRITGVKVIPVGVSVKQCFKALKNNEIVGILGDRDFSGKNGILVDFLGKQMLAPRGPVILSIRTGAPIVPVFVIRDEKNEHYFKYFLNKPIYPQSSSDAEDNIRQLTQHYVKIIESYVKRYPDQWYLFREFWRAEKVIII
ncbi:MAG: lysophospholipid acyltransferase family protein [Candidatus Omnitrophica bacterium]|nr:lysophospholipid acyltransferase family protein [Candidatus Omnitrophota bacterium]